MRLVFFDFDRTLTTRDTILSLGFLLAGAHARPYANKAQLLRAMLLLKSRLYSNHRFKKEFCRTLLTGWTEQQVAELSEIFWRQQSPRILRESVVHRLRSHRHRGDEIYIVSSNFVFALRPWEQQLRIAGVVATEPEVIDGRYTGELTGAACSGSEKLRRVVARFGSERVREAVAYGDSRDDHDLLAYVKTAVWV
jgi:phosphatidylglycerophosphatase C